MTRIYCRGGRQVHLPEGRTALIAIDMQADFLEPWGQSGSGGRNLGLVRAAIPKVARLLEWARGAGISIWHTREAHAPDKEKGDWPVIGTPGHAIIDACTPLPGEPQIDKAAFSAFHDTDLAERLRDAGITHLILCGVTTSCCVSATLRSAVDHGFICLTVSDACGSFELDDHDRALDLVASEDHLLGDVCDVASIVGKPARIPPVGITIRPMTNNDAEAVMSIYAAGIAAGGATFETDPGTWEKFNASKRATPRFVAEDEAGRVLGFVMISAPSPRHVYRGICEVTIYVSAEVAGRGVGHALLGEMVTASEREGVWLLTAGIFPQNEASLILHAAHGFQCRGRQIGAGQLQAGPDKGKWVDVLRLERRSEVAGQEHA